MPRVGSGNCPRSGIRRRVVNLRFGIILAAHGGALPRMALPFKLGAGGRFGTGRQWMSWLTLGSPPPSSDLRSVTPPCRGCKRRDPDPCAKCGIHASPCEGVTSSGPVPRPGVCLASRAGRNGRRFAPFKPASTAIEARREWIQVCATRPGESPHRNIPKVTLGQAVTQLDPRKNKQMPAPSAGGLYETRCQQGWPVFVEADPSRDFWDGSGTF